MASRYFRQFLYTFHNMLTWIEGSFKVGASGQVVPGSYVGAGLPASSTIAVSKVAGSTGIYCIRLQDDYNRFLGASFTCIPGPDGAISTDGDGTIILGKPYTIVNPSTGTNWNTLGVPPGIAPVVGLPFVPTSGASNLIGSSTASVGTGTMVLVGKTGVQSIEMLPNVNAALSPTSASSGVGGSYLMFQCLSASSGFQGTTGFYSSIQQTVNPTSGCVIRFNLMMRNSSVGAPGESSSAQ